MLKIIVALIAIITSGWQDTRERHSYADLMVPVPMNSMEFEWYLDVLDVTEEQHELLQVVFTVYEASIRESLGPLRTELREHSRTASMARQAASDRGVEAFRDALNNRAEYTKELDQLDEQLLINAEAAIGPDDETALEFMRHNRRRFRLSSMQSNLPGADSDYIAFTIALDGEVFDRELMELSTRYMHELVPLREKYNTAWTMQTLRMVSLTSVMSAKPADYPEMTQEEFSRMRQAAFDERREIAAGLYRIESDLQALNNRYRPEFRGILASQQLADDFEQLVRPREFPMVYPDPVSAIPILQRAMELEISDDARRAIREQLVSALSRHETASQRMAARMNEWKHQASRTLSFSANAQQEYKSDLVKLETERVGIAQESIKVLRAILPEEVASGFNELLELEARLKRFDPERRHFPSPRSAATPND